MTMPPGGQQEGGQGGPIDYQGSAMVDRDSEHVKILSILWWVLAGLQGLGMCGGVFYIVMGIMFSNMPRRGGEPPMGIIFVCMGAFVFVLMAMFSLFSYLTGKALRERRRLTMCYVMSALVCLSFPLGTALGVFTFIVLARPGVKGSFR